MVVEQEEAEEQANQVKTGSPKVTNQGTGATDWISSLHSDRNTARPVYLRVEAVAEAIPMVMMDFPEVWVVREVEGTAETTQRTRANRVLFTLEAEVGAVGIQAEMKPLVVPEARGSSSSDLP